MRCIHDGYHLCLIDHSTRIFFHLSTHESCIILCVKANELSVGIMAFRQLAIDYPSAPLVAVHAGEGVLPEGKAWLPAVFILMAIVDSV